MKTSVRLISAGTFALGLILAAPAVANAAAPVEDVMSPADDKHAGARRVFERALRDVELRPDQIKAVEELKSEAKKRHEPAKAAKRELMKAVADQIEAGKIDRCALGPQIDKVASAKAQAHPGDRAAFEKLHSILDRDQRSTFVDALKEHWQSHRQRYEPAALADKMTRELGLSEEQKSKVEKVLTGLRDISQALGVHEEHAEKWSKILEAFKSDRFVLDEIAPAEDVEAKMKNRIEAHLWAAEAVIPILDKDQRALLAKKIREKASGHHEAEEEGGMASSMD